MNNVHVNVHLVKNKTLYIDKNMSSYVGNHGLFLSQFFISSASLGFLMYMLINGGDPGIYLPILTTIVGVWVPSPTSLNKQTTPTPNAPLESVLVHTT